MRQQIASALNMIVHVSRLSDGTRKVMKISEISGMEGEMVMMQDLFEFKRTGVRARRQGHQASFVSTGIRSTLRAAAGIRAGSSSTRGCSGPTQWWDEAHGFS